MSDTNASPFEEGRPLLEMLRKLLIPPAAGRGRPPVVPVVSPTPVAPSDLTESQNNQDELEQVRNASAESVGTRLARSLLPPIPSPVPDPRVDNTLGPAGIEDQEAGEPQLGQGSPALQQLLSSVGGGAPRGQSPGLGAAIPQAQVSPPGGPEELNDRIKNWEDFFKDPEIKAALMQFGISLLQGRQGTGSNILQGLVDAGGAIRRTREEGTKKSERERKADLEERTVGAREKTAEASSKTADAALARVKAQANRLGVEFNQKAAAEAVKQANQQRLKRTADILAPPMTDAEFDKIAFDTYRRILKNAAGIAPAAAAPGRLPRKSGNVKRSGARALLEMRKLKGDARQKYLESLTPESQVELNKEVIKHRNQQDGKGK